MTFSCEKEENVQVLENEVAPEATISEPLAYTEQNLKVLGKAAASLSDDPEFRKILYSEIEKQFDGEYNVLFETLAEKPSSKSTSIGKRMSTTSKTGKGFFKAQQAFKGIEDTDYYPQIYIPFFEELKAKKENNNAKVLSTEKEPVIVIFTGDEAQEVFPGYRLNEDGELEELSFQVDEYYARNNEVWVISLNERFFGNKENKTGETTGNEKIQTVPGTATITDMALKCHFESWAAGASEAHIISVFSDLSLGEYTYYDYGNGKYEGGEIYKFSRKQVKEETEINVNYKIVTDWDNRFPDLDYLNYAIFEYDTLPTGTREVTWTYGSTVLRSEYRSSEKYYNKNRIYKDNLNYNNVDDNCIKWSSSYQ